MKVGIIALCVALVALAFGVFATINSLEEPSAIAATSSWSVYECQSSEGLLEDMWGECALALRLESPTGCGDVTALRMAINENCP